MNSAIYNHVRTANHVPVATICAVNTDSGVRIGTAVCRSDEHFVKRIGREEAYKRAVEKEAVPIPNRRVRRVRKEWEDKEKKLACYVNEPIQLKDLLDEEIGRMKIRAEKYFNRSTK